MRLKNIVETSIYSENVAEMVNFYEKILGLELIKPHTDRTAFLKLGHQLLIIFNPNLTKIDGKKVPPHGTDGAGHIAFEIPDEEYDTWKEFLISNSVSIERETIWDSGASIYFRDPGNNSIEFTTLSHWSSVLDK